MLTFKGPLLLLSLGTRNDFALISRHVPEPKEKSSFLEIPAEVDRDDVRKTRHESGGSIDGHTVILLPGLLGVSMLGSPGDSHYGGSHRECSLHRCQHRCTPTDSNSFHVVRALNAVQVQECQMGVISFGNRVELRPPVCEDSYKHPRFMTLFPAVHPAGSVYQFWHLDSILPIRTFFPGRGHSRSRSSIESAPCTNDSIGRPNGQCGCREKTS